MLMLEYLAGIVFEDRVKRGMREAEQRRLLHSAEDRGTGQARWSSTPLTLGGLLGLMVARLR